MADPIHFPSTTPSMDIPLLFVGQAQKDFFINQAFSIIDALATRAVSGVLPEPPADPIEGQCFLVGQAPTADWFGHTDKIACRIGGSWHFIDPVEGMEVFDQSAQRRLVYMSQWAGAPSIAEPAGGTVVDVEAREAISALILALKVTGTLRNAP